MLIHYIKLICITSFIGLTACKVNNSLVQEEVEVETTTSSENLNPKFADMDERPSKPSPECIDQSKVDPNKVCDQPSNFVCGCNNVTYKNACEADKAGVSRMTRGACKKTSKM